jgi:transcriptional regulator with XRE-family HTH domain
MPDNSSAQLPEPDGCDQKGREQTEARINHLLRQARKERTWSQAELAELVGVAKETISRWEHGVSRPQPNQLRKLCEIFDRKPEELGYALEPLKPIPETPVVGELPPDITAIEPTLPAQPAELRCEPLIQSGTAQHRARPLPQLSLTRRRLLTGLALTGLAGGAWFSWPVLAKHIASPGSTQERATVVRYWPTITYDPYQPLDVIRTIQWMLLAHHYDIGPTGVDGYFGPRTLAAIIQFQTNQHLKDTGSIDGPTWEHLIIPSSLCSSGSPVMALQERLKALGFLPKHPSNGKFDLQTEQAVRNFQQHMHITQQGIADLNTWCVLVGGILRT